MKNIHTITLCVLLILFQSCEKYLNVSPKSSISQEDMFETEIGFQQALSGIYSQLAGQALYGDRLSLGFVSALSQDYGVSTAGAPYVQTKLLNYSSEEVIGHLNTIWSGAYTAIAGVNNILLHAETNRNVLSDEGYALIKGEALGLRAYLHFDLLRLFGSEYTMGSSNLAIPYKKTIDQYTTHPSTTADVVEQVLQDVEDAGVLLKDVDPMTYVASHIRRVKMNYWAIKGLEARVKLYKGDYSGAYSAAKIVVDSNLFPFVSSAAASAGEGTRDRIYIDELLFGIRCRDMVDWVDFYFRFNMGASYKLTRTAAQYNTRYESTAYTNDIRRLYWFESDQGSLFPSKYWQTYTLTSGQSSTSERRLDQLIPLIRLSEMYYILAESATDPLESLTYLNTIRQARAVPNLINASPTKTFLDNEIRKEYEKEFYGEGQIFYYYKRKNIVRMIHMTVDVPLSVYKLPIPDTELEYNPNY